MRQVSTRREFLTQVAGATAIAAVKHGRHAIGIDRHQAYLGIAEERLALLRAGTLPLRPLGMPVRRPKTTERVARLPDEWLPDTDDPESPQDGGDLAER